MIDQTNGITTGYHLFLEPEGAVREQLEQNIARLAHEYDGPVFAPHVTLLAGIPDGQDSEVLRVSELLATKLAPFGITLNGIGREDKFFRALYLHAEMSDELHDAHSEALSSFGLEDEFPYAPHLSLLYGQYPEDAKQASVSTIDLAPSLQFLVDALHVYKTVGPAEAWEKIATIPFSKQS